MDLIDIGGILVAVIAALGAWAAQRSASKASKINMEVSSRLSAEEEAYDRARAFDTETMRRQEQQIIELRKENHRLRNDLVAIRLRVNKLERAFPDWERVLNEQRDEDDDQE